MRRVAKMRISHTAAVWLGTPFDQMHCAFGQLREHIPNVNLALALKLTLTLARVYLKSAPHRVCIVYAYDAW